MAASLMKFDSSQGRPNGRAVDALRPISFEVGFTRNAAGSVLTRCGETMVLCTCSIEQAVPPFLVGKGKGWLTAEYSMLPGSTHSRKPRDKAGKVDGRSVEIQRLIGRSLRAVLDLTKLGERTLWIDCDVLQADGGTRTTAINGALVALLTALNGPAGAGLPVGEIVTDAVAAVSVGIVANDVRLDLEYVEDSAAEVDMNLVMTGNGRFIEVQGSGEEATFTEDELRRLIEIGKGGIRSIIERQRAAVGTGWPWSPATGS